MGLNDDVREIIDELDADGGGFQTSEAAGMLVHRLVASGICTPGGDPKPKVRTLMRMGAGVAFKGYKSTLGDTARKRERAEAASGYAQGDFQEVADGFDRLQYLIDANPGWADHPNLTVADILDIKDIGD